MTSQTVINTNINVNDNTGNIPEGKSSVSNAGVININSVATINKAIYNNNTSQNNIAASGEVGKQKKVKLHNNATEIILPAASGYSKDHLDAWLEGCLKDTSTIHLSSSSEFLDYSPSNNTKTAASPTLGSAGGPMFVSNFNHKNIFTIAPTTTQQQQFAMKTNLMKNYSNDTSNNHSLNNLPPSSQAFQKDIPNLMKNPTSNVNRYSMMFPQEGGTYCIQNDGSHEFASLPPMVNVLCGDIGTSEHEINSTDVLDGNGYNLNINRGFSDPCLLNPSDNDSKLSDHNTRDRGDNVQNDIGQSKKFFNILMEQIQLLHESNAKICRDLHETKVCVDVLKHAPNLGMRQRRDSISGLSTHSQPMVFGSAFGGQSPAPSYYTGTYAPGMMADFVREVKDAARVREDALLNRIKVMLEERQWTLNESNMCMIRDIEELKSQVHHLRVNRKDSNKRLYHLEAENKYMRQMLAALYNNCNVADIICETQTPSTKLSDNNHITEPQSTISTPNMTTVTVQHAPESANKMRPVMSPPSFSLVSSPGYDEIKKKKPLIKTLPSGEGNNIEHPAIMNVSPLDLRRELEEAVAARKEANERIIELENLVKSLQVSTSHPRSFKSTDNRREQQIEKDLSSDDERYHKYYIGSNTGSSGTCAEELQTIKLCNNGTISTITNCKNNVRWSRQQCSSQGQKQKQQYSGTHSPFSTTPVNTVGNLVHINAPVNLSSTGQITDL